MTDNRRSLNSQFMLVAVIIAIFLISGWVLGNNYVDKVILRNTQSLALRDKVNTEISNLRHSLWLTDNLLNNYMLTQNQGQKEKLIATLNRTAQLVANLNKHQNDNNEDFRLGVEDLEIDYKALHHDVEFLLDKSSDPNWVYPILPYINSVLLESNKDFETACNLALQEIESMEINQLSTNLYRLVVEIRSRWRLKILNFRAVIIRYTSLNTRSILAQEKNIYILDDGINEKLDELEAYRSKNQLGIDTDTALDVMKYRSMKWSKDFTKLVELRKTNKWRSDIDFVKNNIIPRQDHLLSDLKLLETQISQWSLNNITKLENATHDINNMFGKWRHG